MHQARIAPLDPPYDTETAAALQSIMPPGMEPLKLFRTQARNLRVFKRMVAGNRCTRDRSRCASASC